MHSSKHTGDEPVDSVTLLNEWDERRDSTFVVGGSSEVSESELLERVDLILEGHEVGDGLVSGGAMEEKVSYELSAKARSEEGRKERPAHPSLGSSIPRSVTYSSYSKRPLKSG